MMHDAYNVHIRHTIVTDTLQPLYKPTQANNIQKIRTYGNHITDNMRLSVQICE